MVRCTFSILSRMNNWSLDPALLLEHQNCVPENGHLQKRQSQFCLSLSYFFIMRVYEPSPWIIPRALKTYWISILTHSKADPAAFNNPMLLSGRNLVSPSFQLQVSHSKVAKIAALQSAPVGFVYMYI